MSTVAEAWGLIDHALVRLKTTELAEEMHKSIRAEENQIRFDHRHNQNSQAVPSLLLQMHERRIDEYIEATYKLYCEVWQKQGYIKTAEFVRAVSAHVIPVIISARKGGVISELSMERARTAGLLEPHKARITSFERSMQRLAACWARKLEIEARECEHAERQKKGFDQRENTRKAISSRKAEIERINRQLDKLPSPGTLGPYGKPIQVSQNYIQNLIRRRLEHEAALAELERGESRPAISGDQAIQPDLEPEHADPLNASEARITKVATGVAEISLVDLNNPIPMTLRETSQRLRQLGAPIRSLTDPRILNAADYKIANPKSTYREVSIRFFQTPGRADSIRYWVNKRKSSDKRQ